MKSLSNVAAFVDYSEAEAVFFGKNKLKLPINYSSKDLVTLNTFDVDELERFVLEKIHKDQKSTILSSVLFEFCKDIPEADRFRYIVKNIRRILNDAQEGYNLFASEFSYEKIKSKTEEAISEYANKIHKTFHDIQNQILGVPLATVIVAVQLKKITTCGNEFWTNTMIAIGATLFAAFLTLAIFNQIMTLTSINSDLTRQKEKLKAQYALIAEQFISLFDKLNGRVFMHKIVLFSIAAVAWIGVAATWYVLYRLNSVDPIACV
ncbi:hypothetical protein [Ochrobactrum chromiisoli]|uniref:Uncharacterized protein n=1 Tax=Ochrobactrum chromiisoli TaxID=2993941 RepID=A0ABT3QSF0_9HYPH|nr:hypothetical protein [Ochrobactrum chromiisoli]MCX2698538.1 hypothetical protein [Ochrobactrum chromiisoli]